MPEYSQDYSRRKLKAVDAINKEVDKINAIKASGGKVRGNEPKMTLRGLRTLLVSEDSLFSDLVDMYESGKIDAKQLASRIRSRTEKIGADEVLIHSDTIHHGNPLELADALDQMEPDELADLLTEQYETKGQAYGDTRQNVRGQSYTTRGHLAQSTNPRGRYKATNEYSEPGITEVSAHPRGANDPEMKAPEVKPRTRAEAQAFLESREPLVQESQALGAYADKDVRALADQKLQDRGILSQGETFYDPNLPDEKLRASKASLDNIPDETDLAKAFKTPKIEGIQGIITPRRAGLKMPKGAGKALPLVGLATYAMTAGQQARAGDMKGAVGTIGQGVAAEVAGHIPVVNDMIEPEGTGDGTLQGGQDYMQRVEAQRQQREQRQIERQTINRRGRQTKRQPEELNNGQ